MITSCTAYPVGYFHMFPVWHFIEETPGWLCCYSLRSSADWNVKERKTGDFVTVVCRWGLYPSQMSNSASSPLCCSTGNSLWGIEPQANQSALDVVLFWDCTFWVVIPDEQSQFLAVGMTGRGGGNSDCQSCPAIQHRPLRELLASPASVPPRVFSFFRSLKPSKVPWSY